ncbi:aminoglycoside phosphotransferase family protein [Arthrobacter sp. H14-L1]|uniref:aminoglycoside phosphotransferase family protein n=1 Tax=Arthrobacter sp. H14-L1 TaxID=2996697 RepID=UPI00226FDD74|nr:aminoglycoside phosphotransferase family protein [Arthrobacter sp. H14-L1]MCY0904678.1 aminoglycoside resistance protein [Arthrobacter sp. H14-L1]
MAAVVPIPADLLRRYATSSVRRTWLASLPGLLDKSLQRWNLSVDLPSGLEPWNGKTGIVLPVKSDDGTPAVLKIAFPSAETRLEPLALQVWDGHGAVRLLQRDAGDCAMVLERLDAYRSLQVCPVDLAVEVWGGIVRLLSVSPNVWPGGSELSNIADTAERWSDDLPADWDELGRPFDRWLLEAALEVCQTRGAVGRRSSLDVLVHSDLHFMNILGRPADASYAAIDPQPTVGEAEFAVAPCLWNRIPELARSDPQTALRERCADLCAAAGLDYEIARQWTIAREVDNALCYLADRAHPGSMNSGSSAGDAQRSLWVASTLAGRTLSWLPAAHELKTL